MYIKYLLLAMLLLAFFCTRNPVSPSASLENTAFSTDLKAGDTLKYYLEYFLGGPGWGDYLREFFTITIDTIIVHTKSCLIYTTIAWEKWDTAYGADTVYEKKSRIDSCVINNSIVIKNIELKTSESSSVALPLFFSFPLKDVLIAPPYTYRWADTSFALADTAFNCEDLDKENNDNLEWYFERQAYIKSCRVLLGFSYRHFFRDGPNYFDCLLFSFKHKNPF